MKLPWPAPRRDLALNQANLKRQQELRAKNVTAAQDLDTAEANALQIGGRGRGRAGESRPLLHQIAH